jgi:hypothetical protein
LKERRLTLPKKKKTPKKKSSDDSEDPLVVMAAAMSHFPVDLSDPGEIDDLATPHKEETDEIEETPANWEEPPDDKSSE